MEQLNLFDQESEYQPRFQAYLNHAGKTRADEVRPVDYILWISKHRKGFAEFKGLPLDKQLNERLHVEFTEYLFKLGE